MTAYSYSSDGYFLGAVQRQLDPINKVYLVPKNATIEPPPEAHSGLEPRFVEGTWILVESREAMREKAREKKRLELEAQRAKEEAERPAREAKELVRKAAEDRLKSIVWTEINTIAELKAIVKDMIDAAGE